MLGPGLESLQYHHSYGYCPGRSRQKCALCRAGRLARGYRWVYESDIADFFDSVDWTAWACGCAGSMAKNRR